MDGRATLNVYVTTQRLYLDLDDIDNPLKPLYEEQIFHDLIRNTGYNHYSYLIERNELNLEDDWWNVVSNPSNIKFNTLKYQGLKDSEDYSARSIVRISMSLSPQTNKYGRKVLNFLEVTGTVGGIFEI